ncbi:hypothetical protein RGU75_07150 [Glaciimonas sp. CA11.2]|uniref:energy transducer TonB family protein n=1 Tax=Glaciimonas sp. CA11.2 TaxID=3048601 RepID=UPI002AB5CEC5|nr:hypothetical protein [Glaciimonas sp. CA11.2]MDY7546006.1 hypothetical protein [Glaciimonas sp. CA11.2]
MKRKASTVTMCLMALISISLAGCVSGLIDRLSNNSPTIPANAATPTNTTTIDGYKRNLAQRIVAVNSTKVYIGRPQALLRAVIVLKFYIDADGQLLRTQIMRTNKDRAAEAVAMLSVKNAAPFPKPDRDLLRKGEIEISESWLFNTDGRFQLRSIADAQMDE